MRTDNLTITQGATWGVRFPVKNPDGTDAALSGWFARSQIRATASSSVVLYDFEPTIENGNLVTLSVSAADSSAWDWSRAMYDLEIFNADGEVVRLTQGSIAVDREITR